MPGAAQEIVSAFVDESKTTNEVRRRTSRGEQFSSVSASLLLPAVQLASIAATVYLGVNELTIPAALTAIPFVGLTVTQLTIVIRRRDD